MQSFLFIGSDEKGRLLEVEKFIGERLSSTKKNPDFIVLDKGEKASIGIAEVRSLQEYLSLKPFRESKKTALIKEAQDLTTEAQNALLKTLEEPNATTCLILTAPDTDLLYSTIVSRCQIKRLPPKSGANIEEKEFKNVSEILEKLLSATPAKRFKLIEEEGIAKDRDTAINFLNKLAFVTRESILSVYHLEDTSLVKLSPNVLVSRYLNILSLINKYKRYLEANCNVKLTIEVFSIKLPPAW